MTRGGRAIDRATARVRAEAEARVAQVRAACLDAAATLGRTIIGSAAAAVVAWFVLFGVRTGSGTPWIVSGLVVLAALLCPAGALWYLRRQFLFVAALPDQLADTATSLVETVDGTELKARFDALSGKRGLRLALAIGSLVRWASSQVALPSTPQLARVLATVPLATGVGVVGTIGVVLLIPVFAVASAALLLVS